MYSQPLLVIYRLSPGINIFVWFANSGFIFAKFQGVEGNEARFIIGETFLLRVDVYSIRAIIT